MVGARAASGKGMRLSHIYLLLIVLFFAVYLENFWLAALLGAVIVFGLIGVVTAKTGGVGHSLVKGTAEDVEREYKAFEGAEVHLPDPELVPDMLRAAGAKTAEYWWNRKQGATAMNPAQPYADDTTRNTSKYLGSRVITGSTRFLDWMINRVFHVGHFHGYEGELHKGVAAEAAAKAGSSSGGDSKKSGGSGHGDEHGGH